MMNERIRELMAQATKVVEPNDPDYRHEIFDKEKFAELIVKAVFDKIEDERFEVYQPVKESVMNHFGVE